MKQGWEYKKLGEVCEVVTGTTPRTNIPEYWGKGHYWVTPAELTDTTVYVDKTERQITDEALDKTKLRLLPIGTVLLSSRAPIGKVAITNIEMYCNQGFKNCICSDSINNKYLFYFLRLKKDFLNSLGRGATFKEISKSIVENIKLPLPPKSTQLAIVSELDKINELIRLKKEQLKDFDNLAQSIFYEMFGDPVENEMGWEVNQLKDISTITSGYAFPSNDFSEDNPIKVVKITNVGVNEFVTDVSSLPLSYSSKESFKVKCGDIVIALTRTIISNGVKRALVPQSYDGALLNQRVAAIAVMHSCIAKNYIYQLLGTSFVKQYIESHATALNQPNLSITDLKRMPIPLPPLPLQHLFAQRIEQIEHQKAEVQKAITDLETLLASRMQYWFE